MTQQDKHMRVDAREDFAYNQLKRVLLAITVTGMRLIPTRFLSGEALFQFKVLPRPKSDLFLTYMFVSDVVCGRTVEF
jgi:hypothetical protein